MPRREKSRNDSARGSDAARKTAARAEVRKPVSGEARKAASGKVRKAPLAETHKAQPAEARKAPTVETRKSAAAKVAGQGVAAEPWPETAPGMSPATSPEPAEPLAAPAAESAAPEPAKLESPAKHGGGQKVRRPTVFRQESDSLGTVEVPAAAYYGAQTQRAVHNFPVSGRRAHPYLVRAMVAVKKACAMTNQSLGKLDARRAQAICQACDEILGRKQFLDQWVVDVFQAGAGTSFNMNTNEVLANRALEFMGKERGQYDVLSPNDHVNMSQSTNDTFPTAMHAATLLVWRDLQRVLDQMVRVLSTKARIFDNVIKSGRTHLQDAVPVRLGQEFAAYSAAVNESCQRLESAAEGLREVALGGSAVGTGLNTHEKFSQLAVSHLGRILNLPLQPARNLRHRMQSMLPVATMSSAVRNLALELIRIANDLRLMSSGPRTGLAEIQLPAAQPGSSIMPGKVNPSLAECLNMICFQVIGNDVAVAMAVQAGQLELNVMMPGIAAALLDSMEFLKNFLPIFTEDCLEGITVDEKRCQAYFESSVGLATILNQKIGYLKAAEVAKKSVATGRSVLDIIREENLISPKELKSLLAIRAVTEPGTTAEKGERPDGPAAAEPPAPKRR